MNPYLILGIAVVWGLSIVGASTKWASLKVAEVRAEYLERDNKALAAANAEIQRLGNERRAAEEKGATNVATIGRELELEKRKHAKTRAERNAALRSGAERVSVAVSGCVEAKTGEGTESINASGESTETRAFLHPAVAADLEQLAGEADDTASELNACIAVAQEDRRIIAEWNAKIDRKEAPQ